MIRQYFTVRHYWEVMVFWNLDYDLFYRIAVELLDLGFSWESIYALYKGMKSGEVKAATCSNIARHASIVLFNRHTLKSDYLNSIIHEAEHIKQAMLYAYDVGDRGEPPAYTIGYLAYKMYPVLSKMLCDCC